MKELSGQKKRLLREGAVLAIGMLIVAIAVYYIMIPSNIVIGNLAGFVTVLVHFIPLKVSILTLLLNIILLILGAICISREFACKTVAASLLLPFYLSIFEKITPNPRPLTDNTLTNVLCFVLIHSLGQMLLFGINASSGGTDVIAKLMNRYLHLEIGQSLAIIGFLLACTSIFVYDTQTLVYSLLGTYLGGTVLDFFIDGTHIRKRVAIISPHYAEIQQFAIETLHRGVTLYPARGGWDNSERIALVVILQKNEYAQLLAFVHEKDPCAFVTVSTVGEVFGRWTPHRILQPSFSEKRRAQQK